MRLRDLLADPAYAKRSPTYRADILGPRPRAKPRNLEHKLQEALVEHLNTHARKDIFWTAIPLGMSGVVWRRKIKKLGGRNGSPDMLFIIAGVPHGLELKYGDGVQSPAQKQAMRDWRAARGIYEVARGIDEALDAVTRWGCFR